MKASQIARVLAVAGLTLLLVCPGQVLAAGRLLEFLPKAQPSEVFPGADRFGTPQGEPPLAGAYAGDRLLGHVYLNSDFTNAVGYSGKPIQMLVGIDPQGVIRGIKLVDHKEPIVLVGIPEKRVVDSMNALIGKAMTPICERGRAPAAGRYRERRDGHGPCDERQRGALGGAADPKRPARLRRAGSTEPPLRPLSARVDLNKARSATGRRSSGTARCAGCTSRSGR